MPAKSKTLDRPAEVLYWTLTPGQRHRIATQLGVVGDKDQTGYPGECERAQKWLQRARARGSFGDVIKLAERMHRSDLRHIEETIRRFGYRRLNNGNSYPREDALMDELEEYRQRHYQWLSYA